jgi:hypothetical protein
MLLQSTEQSRRAPPSDIKWGELLETLGDALDGSFAPLEGYLFGSDALFRRRVYAELWEWTVPPTKKYGVGVIPEEIIQWFARTTGLKNPAGRIIWVLLDTATGPADVAGLVIDVINVVKDQNPETVGDGISSVAGVVAFFASGPLAAVAGAYEAGYNVGKLVEWASEQLFGRAPSDVGSALSDVLHPESPPYKDPDAIEWYSQCWIARKKAEAKRKQVEFVRLEEFTLE